MSLGITPQSRDFLLSLIEQILPSTEVWAFGSRINGTSRPCSDLDLVLFTKPEQYAQVSLRCWFTPEICSYDD
ncbi:MAG: nucleotidyltransferase domain-containing protein [Treponema sp.]|jgi:DNA polymerase sigma|nr:nucleotidyltransferase domain-containing protein [Treponema sp.]